jgi:4'-phosphopantetheinyl transferase EntD
MQGLNGLNSTANTKLPFGLVLKTDTIMNCQGGLYADEKKLISSFSLGRKREFTAGRVLARRAFIDLGEEPCSILSDETGCPLWPESIVGSISHKGNNCCVLVGLRKKVASVGIDIELQEPLPQEMWSSFSTNEEVSQKNFTNYSDEHFANIIFSVKEAFYKCINTFMNGNGPPLTKILLSFNELNEFFQVKTSFGGQTWEGKLFLNDSHMMTVVWLPGNFV